MAQFPAQGNWPLPAASRKSLVKEFRDKDMTER